MNIPQYLAKRVLLKKCDSWAKHDTYPADVIQAVREVAEQIHGWYDLPPPENAPVLFYSAEWVDDFNPRGVVEGYYNQGDGIYYASKYNPEQDCWDTIECTPDYWTHAPLGPDGLC